MGRPILLFIALTIIALSSCNKVALNPLKPTDTTKSVTPPVDTTNVYIAGYDGNDAVYWENNERTVLSRTFDGVSFTKAEAQAIIINNGDVYVVGFGVYTNGTTIALLWKNGIPDTLERAALKNSGGLPVSSRALSITISGNDIYIGGDENSSAQFSGGGVIWKNGIPTIYDPFTNSFSTILIANGTLYAAGSRENHNADLFPFYLRNNLVYALPSHNFSWVHDITVLDTNVIVVGSDYFVARYWLNGIEMRPQSFGPEISGEIISVATAGKDVYIAGYITEPTGLEAGVLCKNDTTIFYTQNTAYFSRVAVNNKNVYLIGNTDTTINAFTTTTATVWKNQVPTRLSTKSSDAFGIYIH